MPESVPAVVVAERQQQTAGDWSNTLRAEIPALSDDQLTSARINITTGLAILKTQRDTNPETGGVDPHILSIARQTNEALRRDIIEEMRSRGLTE